MTIGASTRLFALLGDPISHSRSPIMHNAAFQALGLDAVYVALRCDASAVGGLILGIAGAGGGGNVTVPHKTLAVAALQQQTEAVRRTGACNTYWLEDGRVCGDNTDVAGVRAAVEALAGPPAGMRVLVLGAGGGARAAAVAFASAGAAEVAILNRSAARSDGLIGDLQTSPPRLRLVRDLDPGTEEFDLVVNTTTLGLSDADPLPFDLTRLRRAGAALDMVYVSGGTAWTRHAATLGIPSAGGEEMLVAQGAAAFERWWQRPAPLAVMRAALAELTPDGMAMPHTFHKLG